MCVCVCVCVCWCGCVYVCVCVWVCVCVPILRFIHIPTFWKRIDWSFDFNGMSSRQLLLYAKKLEYYVNCAMMFTFFVKLFVNTYLFFFFLPSELSNTINFKQQFDSTIVPLQIQRSRFRVGLGVMAMNMYFTFLRLKKLTFINRCSLHRTPSFRNPNLFTRR